MPIKNTIIKDTNKLVKFQTTLPMSTYLVCIIVVILQK